MTPDRARAARELLAFYLEAGVDAALGEIPVDRFADTEARARETPRAEPLSTSTARRPQPSSASGGSAAPAPPAPEAAVMAARAAAKDAATLEELRAILD